MKITKIMLGGLLAITATANAMPTQEETKKVEPLVMDLMKDDQVALKSGKKTRVEVAESAMSLADKADTEAAKLLLIKGAFNLYVRAGEFDKAIETLQALQAAIPDIPPANMASIIESSLRVVPRKNGGQLYRLLDETKLRMRYTSAAKKMEKTLKENPTDRQLRTKLAEHYAYLGKWDQALENFAAADGKVGAFAKSERDGDATEKIADFWWAYPNGKAEELVRAFRTHAAKLYEEAIAANAITGLNKVQAERRIEETKEYGENIFEQPSGCECETLVLKVGKETLQFVKIPAGTYVREGKEILISRPFYLMKYPLTLGQWCAITDGKMENFAKKYTAALGGKDSAFSAASIMRVNSLSELLQKRFAKKIPVKGYVFRAPTLAEYDYALHDGVNGVDPVYANFKPETGNDCIPGLNDRFALLKEHNVKFDDSAKERDYIQCCPIKVGSKKPDRHGLYDMLGNGDCVLLEVCAKNDQPKVNDFLSGTDPFNYSEAPDAGYRVWWSRGSCLAGWYNPCNRLGGQDRMVMRLAIGPDLVSEWRAKNHPERSTNPVVTHNSVEKQQKIAAERFARDREVYGDSDRAAIEQLYQEFSKSYDLSVAQKLVDTYPRSNRAGCAILYAADRVTEQKREKLLRTAIEKCDDCYYGDGARVGVLARVKLANLYNDTNRKSEARKLWHEIIEKYPDAIDHKGARVVDCIPDWAK